MGESGPPSLIHDSLSPHSLEPKRRLDRFSRFCRAYDCDRQTNGQTDRATRSLSRIHVRSTAMRPNNNSRKPTLRLLAFDPLSVIGKVASKVVADSLVDGAVVVQSTVQSVRKRTALRRNGRSIVPFTETAIALQPRHVKQHSRVFMAALYVIGGGALYFCPVVSFFFFFFFFFFFYLLFFLA